MQVIPINQSFINVTQKSVMYNKHQAKRHETKKCNILKLKYRKKDNYHGKSQAYNAE